MITLAVGALATWLLRAGFVVLVSPQRLHRRVRGTLRNVGPAVLGAMVVTMLVGHGGLPALVTPSPQHLALLVAGVVAWRVRNVAVPMAAALAVMFAMAAIN